MSQSFFEARRLVLAGVGAEHLGSGMRTAWKRLAAMVLAVLLVASCSTSADDAPAPGISTRPPVDYEALDTAIETKIMSGSVGWQTIEAVLVSVEGTTK